MKVLIPSIVEPVPSPVKGVDFVAYNPSRPIPVEHRDAEALIVWGVSRPMLTETATVLTRLRWVQSLGAGVESILAAGFGSDVLITSGRGLHNAPVAEHTLALVLAAARRLHLLRDAQSERKWAAHLGGVQAIRPKESFRTLDGANVLVWGFGGIAQTLAPMLKLLGASVTGVARSSGQRADTRVVGWKEVDDLLPTADLLVMILPATTETRHALDARRLGLMPAHAWLVNVGRGSTVDEAALVAALESDSLGGAALDVFEEEPLPPSSPLWGLRNVIISPHAAGGRPLGAAQLIRENTERFMAKRPLLNLVATK